MAADGLAPEVARPPATMLLRVQDKWVVIFQTEIFQLPLPSVWKPRSANIEHKLSHPGDYYLVWMTFIMSGWLFKSSGWLFISAWQDFFWSWWLFSHVGEIKSGLDKINLYPVLTWYNIILTDILFGQHKESSSAWDKMGPRQDFFYLFHNSIFQLPYIWMLRIDIKCKYNFIFSIINSAQLRLNLIW